MKRRKFINTTLAASALPLSCAAGSKIQKTSEETTKELYEIRTYEIKFGSNASLLTDYLKNTLKPALMRAGTNNFLLFSELGDEEPKKVWALISYPNSNIYIQAQNLHSDAVYVAAAAGYNAVPANKPIYNRYTSSLLLAFDVMPQMANFKDETGLLELRTYEGYSEDALRRKIKMFNEEEMPVFDATGLNRVFFGEMIAGPHRPSLVYMLSFKDMDDRNTSWGKFLKHPDWNAMKVKPVYANTVSNIRKVFLKPM